MTTWNLALQVVLDRPLGDQHARRLGRTLTHSEFAELLYVSTRDDTGFGVAVAVETEDPWEALTQFRELLVEELADAGYTVVSWEAAEFTSDAEVERRLAAASIPPLVSTEQLAEMCGVSTQRIYELETERRKAAAEGKAHPLPTPVVPGWWIRAAAEHYAANRKRKPGPAPKRG